MQENQDVMWKKFELWWREILEGKFESRSRMMNCENSGRIRALYVMLIHLLIRIKHG